MKIMVSACLLGEDCKYNGGNNRNEVLIDKLKNHEVIPICPEVMGGLSIPRMPAEIVGGIVKTADGTSVDAEFRNGAKKALEIAKEKGVELAVLQPRSPSCGCGQIYDGSFCGKLITGNGIFAQLLIDNGIKVVSMPCVTFHHSDSLYMQIDQN